MQREMRVPDEALRALGEVLDAADQHFELIVIGGSALQALGFISRPTTDVDVLALPVGGKLVPADPLPPDLLHAAAQVAPGLRPSP